MAWVQAHAGEQLQPMRANSCWDAGGAFCLTMRPQPRSSFHRFAWGGCHSVEVLWQPGPSVQKQNPWQSCSWQGIFCVRWCKLQFKSWELSLWISMPCNFPRDGVCAVSLVQFALCSMSMQIASNSISFNSISSISILILRRQSMSLNAKQRSSKQESDGTLLTRWESYVATATRPMVQRCWCLCWNPWVS